MDQKRTCTKVRYASKKDADADIERIKKKSNRTTIPIRSYLCNICGIWHLTSREDFVKKINQLTSDIEKLRAQETTEIEKVKEENRALKEELGKLKQEYNNLKSQGTKEERALVRADIRVQQLTKTLTEKDKVIKGMRKSNEQMIIRLIQLQKQIEEK